MQKLLSVEKQAHQSLETIAYTLVEKLKGLVAEERKITAEILNLLSQVEKQKIFAVSRDHNNKTTTSYYATGRLWVDASIDPLDTRKWISNGISAANNAPVEKFNVGVLQV